MNYFTFVLIALIGFSSQAYVKKEIQQLRSSQLKKVCEYIHTQDWLPDVYWATDAFAFSQQKIKADFSHVETLLMKYAKSEQNLGEDSYARPQVDLMQRQEFYNSRRFQYLLSNPAHLNSLLEGSSVKAFYATGTFIYIADESYVFIDESTSEGCVFMGGDS